jgi:hypothetical protein
MVTDAKQDAGDINGEIDDLVGTRIPDEKKQNKETVDRISDGLDQLEADLAAAEFIMDVIKCAADDAAAAALVQKHRMVK